MQGGNIKKEYFRDYSLAGEDWSRVWKGRN